VSNDSELPRVTSEEYVPSDAFEPPGERRKPGIVERIKIDVLSLWAWFILGVVVLAWLPLVALVRLVTAPFDKGRYYAGFLFRKLAVVHQRLNPLWHFKVTGTPPPDPRHPYVVCSNHESFVDILLLSHLPFEMKWLSKVEITRIPVVGWMMKMAGDIPLNRGVGSSAMDAMEQCADRLDKKVSVMIFPEGTRSATGELGKFKNGAFRLAIDKQVPILPVAVMGTRTALRKHDWRFGESRAEARMLAPIPTSGLTSKDYPRLRDEVRAVIAAELVSMRAATE
jgi:1-acyl-sn-glycerol-3-phosphate acyltransferase